MVGLGNPGRRYAETRHNVGFMVADRLGQRWQVDRAKRAFSGEVAEARVVRAGQDDSKVVLLKPETYMNLSGQAVRQMLRFFKAEPADLLVVLDDTALPLGRIRARASGSGGGHNGLNDIMTALASQEINRLRIGIDPAPGIMELSDYVLGKFTAKQIEQIAPAIEQAADAVEDWIFEGITYVMDKYNRKPDNQDTST